jgi:hypothetical protein
MWWRLAASSRAKPTDGMITLMVSTKAWFICASMLALTLSGCAQNSRNYIAGPNVSAPDREMAKAQCRLDATNNHGGPGSFFPVAEAIYKDNAACQPPISGK